METKGNREGTVGLLSKNMLNTLMMIGTVTTSQNWFLSTEDPWEKLGVGDGPAILDGSELGV